MFIDFFEKHTPETMELPSAESAARIDSALWEKMNGIRSGEEKPMKKKTIKSFILIAAAAVISASALIFSATADYNGDEKYIVRVNNKRADADVYTYENGRVKLDVIVYESPYEIYIDSNGRPVTEDSGIDMRCICYNLKLYASDDPNEQIFDPETGVEMLSLGGGMCGMDGNKVHLIPVPHRIELPGGLSDQTVLKEDYDEKKAKEFWEDYWKDPEAGARKWSEFFAGLPEEEELSMAEVLKKRVSEHFNKYMTEAEKNGVLEFIDQTFGEDSAE